jgi:CheY-like chemotaxis protein/predicted regulator of Ras-like GTPase activity (Roadblock/LC7/MglB family)
MAKVLVVDDSPTIRKVVERALEARSIQVMSAASGGEAIERIDSEAPDLVICDVIMPDRDGYQICQYVKSHPRLGRTPVLLISGVVNGTVLERAAAVGSDDVMRKPFAAEELLRKIDSLLSARPSEAPAAETSGDLAPSLAALSGLVTRAENPVPDSSAALSAPDLKTSLGVLAGVTGVRLVALVDREGFPIESAGEGAVDVELAWALASTVTEAGEGIGRALGQGVLQALILEFEGGIVLLHAVGAGAMLAVVLSDPTVLGKVRYSVKRALPDLLRAM